MLLLCDLKHYCSVNYCLCGDFSSSTSLQSHYHLCKDIQQDCTLELNVMKYDTMLILSSSLLKVSWVILRALKDYEVILFCLKIKISSLHLLTVPHWRTGHGLKSNTQLHH